MRSAMRNRSVMKRENRMLAAACMLPVLVGIFFEQDESYKISIPRFLLLAMVILAYNVLLFVQKAE